MAGLVHRPEENTGRWQNELKFECVEDELKKLSQKKYNTLNVVDGGYVVSNGITMVLNGQQYPAQLDSLFCGWG